MNKQKSYHHPPTNPNFFPHTNYFFSVQLGQPKLSGYGLGAPPADERHSHFIADPLRTCRTRNRVPFEARLGIVLGALNAAKFSLQR